MSKRNRSYNQHVAQARLGTFVRFAWPLGIMAGAVLIVAAIWLAYWPCLGSGFILDDDKLLTDNLLIVASDGLYRFWSTSEAYDYWPVSNSMLWLEWRLWERNPAGYHFSNLVLHLAVSLLIWLVLRDLSIPGALLAAMIFAVHPVNVESAAWIAQRKDDLAIVFFLLSILWYVKAEAQSPPGRYRFYRRGWGRWYGLSLLAFGLGMLSKGSIAILPLMLLGIVWWLRPLTWRDLARTGPFFLTAAALAAVNVWFQTHLGGTIRSASFTVRLLEAGSVVWFYLYKAILPINLVFIYPLWHIDPGDFWWWPPLLAAAIVTVVLWRYRKGWGRPILFAWGYFCVALVPVMGFTDVGFMRHSLVADHYQHIAIIGVIALTAAGWSIWGRRVQGVLKWAATAAAVMTVCVLALLTWLQNGLYSDPFALYRQTLEKNPDCWLIHNNLGILFHNAGRHKEAIEQYEQTLRLNPEYADAHSNLGNALGSMGRWQEAIECYHRALKIMPQNPLAKNNLGGALANLGRFDEAIEQYKCAIQLNPNFTGAYDNLAYALVQAGRLPEAIEQCQQALRLEPNVPQLHMHFGFALAQAGRLQEAIDEYQRALQLKPDYPEAHFNLGNALSLAGRLPESIEHYQQCLRLKPNSHEIHYNLGVALSETGRLQEAIAHFQQAIAIRTRHNQSLLQFSVGLCEGAGIFPGHCRSAEGFGTCPIKGSDCVGQAN